MSGSSNLATQIPATIAALGSAAALVITALNRRTATVTETKTDAQTATIDDHGTDLIEIKQNVSGALTAAKAETIVAEAVSTELSSQLKAIGQEGQHVKKDP